MLRRYRAYRANSEFLKQNKLERGTDERGGDFLSSGGQARASRDGDCSEAYICNLFDWYLEEQEIMDWFSAVDLRRFPLRPENPIPLVNEKGLVERDLTPNEGYFDYPGMERYR